MSVASLPPLAEHSPDADGQVRASKTFKSFKLNCAVWLEKRSPTTE
jgi:hypothetical protein